MGRRNRRDPTLERIRHQPYVAMRELRESTPITEHKGQGRAKRRSSLDPLGCDAGKNIKGPRAPPGRHAGLNVEVVVHPSKRASEAVLCKGNIRSGRLWTFVRDDRPDLPAMFVDSRELRYAAPGCEFGVGDD
jgi:hypothetical protein